MQLCKDCGNVFDWPSQKVDRGTGEHYYVCPDCDEENFDDAKRCRLCNEYAPKNKMTSGACKKCTDETIKKHDQIIIANMTQEEIDILHELDII